MSSALWPRSILYAVYPIFWFMARIVASTDLERRLMFDIIFLAVGTGFFAISMLYVAVCERL
jgi:hypothetical protein